MEPTEEQHRIKNLHWFADIKMIVYDLDSIINDTERDQIIEDIYQVTKKRFKP